MKKRGQVTLFIIVGIVMLLSIGMFIYFKASAETPKTQPAEIALSPVESYITACIDSLTTDALEKIGDQGGYVEIPESIRANRNSYFSYIGLRDAILPFWWYKGTSAIPPLQYISNEISAYVQNNLKVCINNFAPLRSNYNVVEEGNVEAVTSINENDVSVSVKYPIKIISLINDSSQEKDTFNAIMPVRLKKTYEFAREIMEAENNDKFLERKTIDLAVMDQSIPDTDIEATCDKRQWYLAEIQERMKKLIATNFQYIKIPNGVFNDQTYVESPQGTRYNESYFGYHYVWNVSQKTYPGIRATVAFAENWPFYLYARPSKEGVLKSNSQNGFDLLEGLCLHIWHFTYDIVYPVVITLYDERTATHREFRFKFATDVSVKSNTPFRQNFASAVIEPASVGYEDEYCNAVRNEVTILTQDAVTTEPLADVNLTFACGGFSCAVGKSEILGFGAAAGISKKMPYCVSGFIKGSAAGYATAQKNIQSDLKDKAYSLELTPIKELRSIEMVKIVDGKEVQLENVRAYIDIKGPNFGESKVYPFIDDALKLLAKSDFAYNITIYVMDEKSVLGGYIAEWRPSWNSMKDANKITFYVAISDSDDDRERYKFVGDLKEQSKKVAAPRFT